MRRTTPGQRRQAPVRHGTRRRNLRSCGIDSNDTMYADRIRWNANQSFRVSTCRPPRGPHRATRPCLTTNPSLPLTVGSELSCIIREPGMRDTLGRQTISRKSALSHCSFRRC